ncbi:glycosyltransferase [Hanstruepera neustonica]|uniref:Glycosyltransferase n=1 Tax=Hanstruepera neustonica TaxID=1445657 RepID=A0A2K1E4A7_9FLAO|nr:glycosyltransferase [Hanstruepera neustonica]PNQ75116.1 glycosyltransferase [Hanstruepera neustonica]
MIIGTFIILGCYLILIGSFVFGFDKVKQFESISTEPQTNFSIVIPFRNEAENLKEIIDSIKRLEYPKTHFEIIFVDDNSTDDSVSIIKNHLIDYPLDWIVLKNVVDTKSPKKDAIKTAISYSKHDWILTTDADCLLPKTWLKAFDNFIQNQDHFLITGPVKFQEPKSFLEHFQNLDFMSLMGTTIGSFGIKKPFMANGANLAYTKSFFQKLNGFESDLNIASGDDVFLLQKAVKENPSRVAYLKSKNAIVTTKPPSNWSGLISQRIRWASKASSYKNLFSLVTGLIVLLANYLLIILALLVLTIEVNLTTLGLAIILKMVVDYILIHKSSEFFDQKVPVLTFVLSSSLYPFFVSLVAFLATFKGYKWKNRSFHK